MGITINGSSAAGNIDLGTNGTITDLAVGGLPDGTVDGDSVSTIPASKLTGALPAISGASLTGVTDTLSFRNLIVNGACNVAQRGTTKATHTGHGFFTVDRIYTSIGGEDEGRTEDQISLTSSDTGPWAKGFRKAFQITNGNQSSAVGTGDYQSIVIKNEAQDIANSGWDYTSASSYITFSFWVKSSVAQNFYGFLKTQDGTQQYYSFETGSLSANTWTKITKAIPGNSNITVDNNNGEGLSIEILPFLGTSQTGTRTLNTWSAWDANTRTPNNTTTWWETDNATFAITGLQLEVGSTATEFEHRSYGDELQRCLRYCYCACAKPNDPVAIGAASSSDYALFTVRFPVPMRAEPSMEAVSGGSGVEGWELMPSGNSSAYFYALNGSGRVSLTAFNVRANISSNFTAKQAYFLNNANAGGTDAVPKGLIFNAEL